MERIAVVPVDLTGGNVYEHGWQSWSPNGRYGLTERPARPPSHVSRVMNWRPDREPPPEAFWGEGLLALQPESDGEVHLFAARPGAGSVPSIRADVIGNQVHVAGDGPVEHLIDPGNGGLAGALGRWAAGFASRVDATGLREAPTVWCSWYHYFRRVTEADIEENLAAIDTLGLAIDVVQIDDGFQAAIGDWLTGSDRFASLADTVARIRAGGRRAGIWLAPFLVSPSSEIATAHPEWIVEGISAGTNWGHDLAVLDVTHPGAADHLERVLDAFCGMGIDFFEVDFVYAGAIDGPRTDCSASGLDAYAEGMRQVRAGIGDDAYLLGCGAPMLPSVGLVDAMRVSPDTAPWYEPPDGDISMPSQLAANLTGRQRAWQHGRFWMNDPDCLLVRPAVERREEQAAHVERHGGMRSSSDRRW